MTRVTAQAGEEGKTFTQADIDRIIANRLARETKDMDDAIARAVAEAEKRASLTAEEKTRADAERHAAQLAEKERDLAIREARLSAVDAFAKAGLPVELADFTVSADAGVQASRIEQFRKTYQKAVADGVAAKLAGNPPADLSGKAAARPPGKSAF